MIELPLNQLHVVPIDDLRPHECAADCWCRPTQDTEREDVFLHHALDGRERYESGEIPLQ